MKALIIDDEKHIHQGVKTILNNVCPEVDLVGSAFSVQDGLTKINDLSPDLILLDIRMDDGTGFELLNQLPKPYPQIIFITAHDEYAINAFKFSAVDYLMKPIDSSELRDAITRAGDRQASALLKAQLDQLTDFMQARKQKKVVLRDADQVYAINKDDILWVRAEGSYTSFMLNDQPDPVVVSKNLKEYELLLDSPHFYRIHRSFLINCKHFVRYHKTGGYLIFSDNKRLQLALKKEQIRALLERL